jgi:methionyl-tRNA synthetase
MNKNFFISTPIYYPSGKPHIGTAYATALADVIAKYKRLIGYDVFFLTGLDEHGQKVQEAAEKNGFANPQAYTDDVAKNFVDLWKKMDISNTKFIRTTDQYHVESVKKIFSQMIKNNDIYLGK